MKPARDRNPQTSSPAGSARSHDDQTPTVVEDSSGDDADLSFSRHEWDKLFHDKNHTELSREFLRILRHFTNVFYLVLSPKKRALLNDFVESFLYYFCDPEFEVPSDYAHIFVAYQPTIATVVAMSDFGTTTPWVFRLMLTQGNFVKILVLHNVRCAAPVDPKLIFDINARAASEWWNHYWASAVAFCTRKLYGRIRDHLEGFDDRFVIFGAEARAGFFQVTYIAPELERKAKEIINLQAKKAFANVIIKNRPNRRKILVASGRWYRSAVYTSLSPLINTLRASYDLSLLHYGTKPGTILDEDLFEHIYCVKFKNQELDLAELQGNEFCAVIYPDIGMDPESVFFSNIRLAPVQACMYGHPSSSWSTEIDYFIGGRKVEIAENAGKNYGERLVLLPGMGVYPVIPEVQVSPEAETDPGAPIVINCGWTTQKITYPLLCALQAVLFRAKRHVIFRMFAGNAGQHNRYIPLYKDITSMIPPENLDLNHGLSNAEYLNLLAKGSFSLDSYPFGGFNTIIDALYCKKPIVAWEGDRAFNRFTSATLDIIGMPELIARSKEEYVDLTVRMINDNGFRRKMTTKLASIDLKESFARHENPEYFRKAIDYLVDNNERLKTEESRAPIFIE